VNDDLQDFMAEATRLTRAGRLGEATSLIQRTLGGLPASPATSRADAPSTPHAMPRSGPRRAATLMSELPGVNHRFAAGHGISPQNLGARLRKAVRWPGGLPPTAPSTRPPSTVLPGRFVAASHTSAAGTRHYKLYVPTGYTGEPVPLVVMLHGGTQGVEDFASGTRMNELAERETFLVAYPEQSPSANNMRYWNWFRSTDQQRTTGEPSLIAGITRDVMGDYRIAPGQVYVTGFSAGGAMAAVMAATHPDLYAAAGVHSGLAYAAANDVASAFAAMKQGPPTHVPLPGKAIPLIVFHGDRDDIVDELNADRLRDQWVSSANTRSGSIPTQAGEPTVRRGRAEGGLSYTQLICPDARGGVVVEQWTVHGGGHAWSGGGPHGSYTDPQGPDASAEMMRFFLEHRGDTHETR
jgi:poly(hydroxyalkanoate) depolymerase family esterase